MEPSSIITLTTDFGTADPYVGMMKGVILGINPQASIVDISHQVQPQSIREGAYVIGASHRYFPQGTIHVVVVDPGVGSSRHALLLATPSATVVAPDNGVLSRVLSEGYSHEPEPSENSQVPLPSGYTAYRLEEPEFWLQPLSATFHGRDVFAPVAAHLSLGIPPQRFGPETSWVTYLPSSNPRWEGTMLVGEVVHVDRFGNLMTNIPSVTLTEKGTVIVEIKGRRIDGLSSSYSGASGLLAIVGSHGDLEVSVKDGNAAAHLGVGVGEPVELSFSRDTGPS